MTPYYDRDGIVIYHGDCRDVLPDIDPDSVDLLLTDPPYGIGYSGGASSAQRWASAAVEGDSEPFDPAHLLAYKPRVLWGGNYYTERLPEHAGGWIVWSKAQDNRMVLASANHRSTGEMAWTDLTDKVLVYNCFWMGSPLYRKTERGSSLHPTQKPVDVMRWIVDRWTKPGDLVLDPYMGSGPVAQACHELGRRYIGIELVEDYCKVAVSRLAQQTLDLDGGAA